MEEKPKGTETIKIALYFWTNIDKEDKFPRKQCWESGYATVVTNHKHGISSKSFKNFRNIEDIPNAIKEICKREGITMHSTSNERELKKAFKIVANNKVV